jgi:hypothetical protein
VFWTISAYFNIGNTLPKSGTFLLGHPVYVNSGIDSPAQSPRRTNTYSIYLELISISVDPLLHSQADSLNATVIRHLLTKVIPEK